MNNSIRFEAEIHMSFRYNSTWTQPNARVIVVVETIPSSPSSSSLVDFNLYHSSDHYHIRSLLCDQLDISYHWLCDQLVPRISSDALELGLGYAAFTLTMNVKVHNTVVNDERSLRMVLQGMMKTEELKSLMETDLLCSICLENLSGSKRGVLTLMNCSHVFHSKCLMEWLKRKNTCPMCRTVL